jgi:hypothetical protein
MMSGDYEVDRGLNVGEQMRGGIHMTKGKRNVPEHE